MKTLQNVRHTSSVARDAMCRSSAGPALSESVEICPESSIDTARRPWCRSNPDLEGADVRRFVEIVSSRSVWRKNIS